LTCNSGKTIRGLVVQLTEQLGDVNPTLEYNADEQIVEPPADGFQLFKKAFYGACSGKINAVYLQKVGGKG
jgi:hypothetical protein